MLLSSTPEHPTGTTVIDVRNVVTELGGQRILEGIDLTVTGGEVVALLGGNGSGKTTLMRTILGLVPHQSGDVEVFGTPIERFRDWKRIGYVPQRGRNQVPNVTVRELVSMGLLSQRSLARPLNRGERDRIEQALARVGLAGRGQIPIGVLSGGQQQRAMIARALVGSADVLFLDEPLTALDVAAQASLAQLLKSLNDEGKTIVVILHELGPMEPMLTRGVVLQNGHKIYDGRIQSGADSGAAHCATVEGEEL